MQSRSLARELALLLLGQIPEGGVMVWEDISLEALLQQGLDSLMDYWRERLDSCAGELETAQQQLIDSELKDFDQKCNSRVREHLQACLSSSEKVINSLSASLEFPRLLILADQEEVRNSAMERVRFVIEEWKTIDSRLDDVMEGWRLRRLPRIDRDILRLAVVDLTCLQTPAAVTCNEAVELAHRYSDEQGRRMINGVLRRLQTTLSKTI